MTLTKTTEEWIVATEEEAEALIAKAKTDPENEGYELTNYSSTKKTKKEEEWVVVKLTKVW